VRVYLKNLFLGVAQLILQPCAATEVILDSRIMALGTMTRTACEYLL